MCKNINYSVHIHYNEWGKISIYLNVYKLTKHVGFYANKGQGFDNMAHFVLALSEYIYVSYYKLLW